MNIIFLMETQNAITIRVKIRIKSPANPTSHHVLKMFLKYSLPSTPDDRLYNFRSYIT